MDDTVKKKAGYRKYSNPFPDTLFKETMQPVTRTEGYKEEYNALLSHCFLSSAQLANHKVATNVRSLVAVGPW